MGAKTSRRAKSGGLAVVQVPPGTDVAKFIARLSDQPGVKFAEQDSLVYEAVVSNDIAFPHQWALPKIGAPAAWDISEGASVRVAVVDSGVDLSHQDLLGRFDAASGYNFVTRGASPQDDDGHGTHVAGIIGATLNNGIGMAGVANKCTIIPVKVMNSAGTGSSSNVAEGIYWAADHGADVINLSLGAPISSAAIESAVQYAVNRDCVVVAASGNEGSNQVFYPAAAPNVIGVAATDKNDVRPGFSNYGPNVDISAPGLDIYSTWPGGTYRWGSGTSMSAPHVSGVVALIRAKNPSWTRAMVERQLLGTALDLGAVGRDDYFGYGRVQADRALTTTVTAGTLRGRVTFRGAPFAGVVVSVPDRPAVVSDADGMYVVPDVTPFTYGVTFSKSGFENQTIGISIPDGGTATQDVALRARVTLSTPKVYGRPSAKRGTILRGSVRPARSTRTTLQVRRLVRGHWRTYRSYSVRVNPKGAWYSRPKLKRGTYSIRVVFSADSAYAPGASAWRKAVVK
jgi:subtilisin family serine protease